MSIRPSAFVVITPNFPPAEGAQNCTRFLGGMTIAAFLKYQSQANLHYVFKSDWKRNAILNR
jgi:hypothetical protein